MQNQLIEIKIKTANEFVRLIQDNQINGFIKWESFDVVYNYEEDLPSSCYLAISFKLTAYNQLSEQITQLFISKIKHNWELPLKQVTETVMEEQTCIEYFNTLSDDEKYIAELYEKNISWCHFEFSGHKPHQNIDRSVFPDMCSACLSEFQNESSSGDILFLDKYTQILWENRSVVREPKFSDWFRILNIYRFKNYSSVLSQFKSEFINSTWQSEMPSMKDLFFSDLLKINANIKNKKFNIYESD